MQKIIFIKYGELSTKKENRNFFIKILDNNIKKVLGKNADISYDYGRMFINCQNDYENTINKLKNVFGIHNICIAYKSEDKELDKIKSNLLELLKDKSFKTFKVEVKRSDKNYPLNSMELCQNIGGFILKNIPNIKVDVHNPELTISIEIRLKEVLIYFENIKGAGL